MSGTKVALKSGGSTETLEPSTASRNKGESVTRKTAAQAAARKRLLTTMAPSRLIGAKRPPAFRAGARMAKSVSEPPMARASRMRMKKPRSGSVAKACTEVSTPERTMKVPMSDREKVRMASRMVHTFSALRFSTTMAGWSSAVPSSQGRKETFSTATQNQQPHRWEKNTSELQSLLRISMADFGLKKKKQN